MVTSILRRTTTRPSAVASLLALVLGCEPTPAAQAPPEAAGAVEPARPASTATPPPATSPGPPATSPEPPDTKAKSVDTWGEIPLLGLDGTTLPFSKHQAPVTVVALWATWCKPCLEELPQLDAYRAQLLERGETDVSFLAISIDDAASLDTTKKTFEGLGLDFKAVLDATGRFVARVVPSEGSAMRLPQLIVLDSDGHMSRTCGYESSEFSDHVDAAIAAARKGFDGDQVHSCDAPSPDVPASAMKFSVPKMTPKELEAFLPELKTMVLSINPTLEGLDLAEVLADAEAQILQGGMVEVPVPAGPSEIPAD